MKRYRITIETENLVSIGIVSAKDEQRAINLFKSELYVQNAEYIDEIAEAEPMIRILGETDEIQINRCGNGVEEIITRI